MKKNLSIVIFILLSLVTTLSLKSYNDYMIENYLEIQTKKEIEHYKILYNSYRKLSEIIFKTKINRKEVREIFKTAFISDIEQKKIIRQKLHNHLKDSYALLKKYNIRQLHFHLPNNESFLRFHKPQKFGDNLTNIRATVKYVNKIKKPISGFEEGRIYSGYRFVFPLFEDNIHIGSVEVSFSALSMTTEFMKSFDVTSNFLILKEIANKKLFQDQKSHLLPTHFEKFYVEKEMIENLKKLDKLKTQHISPKTIDIVNQKALDKKSFSLYDNVKKEITTFIKVENPIDHNVVGLFLVISDAEYIFQTNKNFSFTIIFFIFCFALIIFYIYKSQIATDKLRQNNQQLSSIFEEAESGIALMNLNGDFLEANNACSILFCYSQEELKKLSCSKLSTPNEKNILQTFKKAFIEGAVSKSIQTFKTKSGRRITLELSLKLLPDKHLFIAVLNSLEDKLELEDLNRNLNQKVKDELHKNREKDRQMLHQAKLVQMGEMINMIAHQWRQPLNAISSRSASLKVKAILNKIDKHQIITDADSINEYSQHLSETIDDFRNFFKSNKEIKEIDFSQLLESVLGIIDISLISKNIILIKDLKSKEKFKTYPNELKQVILNLIKNSEDILLDKNIKNPFIKISTYKFKNNHILEVSDNGGGICDNILDKIFDPYFSTKLKKDGTGLGLYMSKTIIEDHCKGRLTVTNNKDGAVFKITL